ncbi:MAG: AbrB/MazE/SpoVT family DNA-binding domain-containing protein [Candidatus Micrarchaeota archaeon]
MHCKTDMVTKEDQMKDGLPYEYWKCPNCGDEIVDMKQLHEVAEKYRNLKQYTVMVSKWGDSDAIRIPRELSKQYRLKSKKTVRLIPEKTGIKIVAH